MIFLVQIFLKIFQGCHLLLGLFQNSAATCLAEKLKIPFCYIILSNYLKCQKKFEFCQKMGSRGAITQKQSIGILQHARQIEAL